MICVADQPYTANSYSDIIHFDWAEHYFVPALSAVYGIIKGTNSKICVNKFNKLNDGDATSLCWRAKCITLCRCERWALLVAGQGRVDENWEFTEFTEFKRHNSRKNSSKQQRMIKYYLYRFVYLSMEIFLYPLLFYWTQLATLYARAKRFHWKLIFQNVRTRG